MLFTKFKIAILLLPDTGYQSFFSPKSAGRGPARVDNRVPTMTTTMTTINADHFVEHRVEQIQIEKDRAA